MKKHYIIFVKVKNKKFYYDGKNLDSKKSSAKVFNNKKVLNSKARLISNAFNVSVYCEDVKPTIKKSRKKNPVPPSSVVNKKVDDASKLYEDFTGHNADTINEVTTEHISVGLTVGKCDGILYTTKRDGETEHYIHEFKKSARPEIIASHDGSQLGLIGGDFEFTERGICDR